MLASAWFWALGPKSAESGSESLSLGISKPALTLTAIPNLWDCSTSLPLSSVSHMAARLLLDLLTFLFLKSMVHVIGYPYTSSRWRPTYFCLWYPLFSLHFDTFFLSCHGVILLFHITCCGLCGTPLNSCQGRGITNAFHKVGHSMGWSVEQWEIEVQSPIFNRRHIHKKFQQHCL